MSDYRCPPSCDCGKHSVRNSGQFKTGVAMRAGDVQTDETRAKIRAARAFQVNVTGGGPTPVDPWKRFLRKVHSEGSCLEWAGALDKKGYGVFGIGSMKDGTRKTIRAHRFSYESMHGAVPRGLELDHLCSNRKCVNPDHLEAVTHRENIRRAHA